MDLYGSCNNRRCPETICSDTISNYKFFFALENANCRDYITEKFWSALARHQVPVVLGGMSSDDYRKVRISSGCQVPVVLGGMSSDDYGKVRISSGCQRPVVLGGMCKEYYCKVGRFSSDCQVSVVLDGMCSDGYCKVREALFRSPSTCAVGWNVQ